MLFFLIFLYLKITIGITLQRKSSKMISTWRWRANDNKKENDLKSKKNRELL